MARHKEGSEAQSDIKGTFSVVLVSEYHDVMGSYDRNRHEESESGLRIALKHVKTAQNAQKQETILYSSV